MVTTALKYIYVNVQSKARKRPGFISFLKLNWKIISAFFLFSAMALLVFYIYGINELTKGAYMIKNYEKQMNTLSLKNKNLQVDFAKTGFLGNLEAKTRELSFEKTKTVKYIQMQDSDNYFVTVK
ncbi:MAG: hypothetical protein HYT36_00905 [Candidatus Staskawiczbacteria bacterium]|nr:hypothetical protein [Candidatus Staskawiczbacteria bacterium]